MHADSQSHEFKYASFLKMPLAALLAIAIFFLAGAIRDRATIVDAFDTGLYLQWLHGFWSNGSLASSITNETNFLAHHFQPIALLLSPLLAFGGRPLTLFLVSALTVAVAIRIFMRASNHHRLAMFLASITLVTHPSIAGAIWYSFTPDILALPAFIWAALALTKRVAAPTWQWVLCFAWAGLCKEVFWLTGASIAFVRALQLFKAKAPRLLWLNFAILSILQLACFMVLYLYWMPKNTSLPDYYGVRFYLSADLIQQLPGKIPATELLSALLNNFLSLQTLKTLALLVLLSGIWPVLRPSIVWISALPGLLLVLLAKDPQLHHPANHYLISVIPFLLVPAACNPPSLPKRLTIVSRKLLRLVVITTALMPLMFITFMEHGFLDQAQSMYHNPHVFRVRSEFSSIKEQHIKSDDHLIVDGILQPLMYDYSNVHVLLAHVGNPVKADLSRRPLKIVTSVDLQAIHDCMSVQLGGPHLRADYQHFRELCALVKVNATKLYNNQEAGLFVFEIK